MGGMSDDTRQPKRSKWWVPPRDFSKAPDDGPIGAVLVVLAVVGWVIFGLFRSLAGRSKSFGLRDFLFLMTGVAILLGLVALAIN
jgi:hypothetical protein